MSSASDTVAFRAEHVGSLLRSAPLLAARERAASGNLPAEELAAIEDAEIRRVVGRQQDIGLPVVTDGEFRRTQWHFDFLVGFDGIEFPRVNRAHVPDGLGGQVVPTSDRPMVVDKVRYTGHPMLAHFTFLRQQAEVTPKFSFPSPNVLHFRNGRAAVPEEIYPDLDEFFADLAGCYRRAIRAFADAGCRYLQIDETSFVYLCDPDQRQLLLARGDDPDRLLEVYLRTVNEAIADAPEGLTIAMHMCRGNNRSNWHAQGGYEPIAERVFGQLNVDGYLLEYDSDRAGDFAPLRHLPSDKRVVLGLLTSKNGQLEQRTDILRRVEDASRYVDSAQLGLGPQCGFASIDKGNILTEDDQWRKLQLVVDIADELWA